MRDAFSLVPERFGSGYEEWEDEDNFLSSEFHEDVVLSELYQSKTALRVGFGDPVLASQWREEQLGPQADVPAINVWLPELRGVELGTLLKLREDENDAFRRIQRAVRRIVQGFETSDSTSALKAVLEEADHEVREYERRLSVLKKRHSRSLSEAVIGMAVLGCCMTLPSESARLVSAFIGSFHMKGFMQSLFRHREAVEDLAASDFYAAVLAGKLRPQE